MAFFFFTVVFFYCFRVEIVKCFIFKRQRKRINKKGGLIETTSLPLCKDTNQAVTVLVPDLGPLRAQNCKK